MLVRKRTLYKVEVGVLLKKTHPDYLDYSQVFDRTHSYFDENTIFFTNKKKAVSYLKKYVRNGVINTYGILSRLEYDPIEIYGKDCQDLDELVKSDLKSIKEQGIIEDYVDMFCGDLFNTDFVIYNIYKTENKKYERIF